MIILLKNINWCDEGIPEMPEEVILELMKTLQGSTKENKDNVLSYTKSEEN